jgi:hypothetical protein
LLTLAFDGLDEDVADARRLFAQDVGVDTQSYGRVGVAEASGDYMDLGVLTFVRLVETSVENMVFLRRMEAIRRYYGALDPAAAAFFASAGDTATTALASTGMRSGVIEMFFTGGHPFFAPGQQAAAAALASTGMRAALTEMFFTGASMIAAVTSILAGAGAALHMLWMYRRGWPAMA